MKTKIQALHEQVIQISRTYLKAEAELITVLQKIDHYRGYFELGYRSLFDYAKNGLGLSENVAFSLISVSRKSVEVPKLKELVDSHQVSLSNAKLIVPVLTVENQDQWLNAAASLSKRELEKAVAKENPKSATIERTKYVSSNRLELNLGVSEEIENDFKKIQDLISTKLRKAASREEVLQIVFKDYLKRNDPLARAERVALKKTPSPGKVKASKRSPLPAALEHAIRIRDQAQCTHIDSNSKRCAEKRWLHFHHVTPVSQGGKNTLENLRTLCSAHRKMAHLIRT